jgi:alkylmercury lyase
VAARPEISSLAEAIAGSMAGLSVEEQRLAVALYRRLARGEPVPAGSLAAELGADEDEIEGTLNGWPAVYRADDGAIVAFGGLAIPEMPHRFRVDGRLLHTWCAWDALFIPELIGRSAEVESQSPVSGDLVRLTVAPEAIVAAEPHDAVVSMLSPTERFDDDVVASFCHFVHFFTSASDAQPWLGQHRVTFLLSLDEAFELGRMTNRLCYGEALRDAGS